MSNVLTCIFCDKGLDSLAELKAHSAECPAHPLHAMAVEAVGLCFRCEGLGARYGVPCPKCGGLRKRLGMER